MKIDLEERTIQFAKQIVSFCKNNSKKDMIYPVVSQLLRSGTSIGANYHEANGASSKRDFKNKIYLCKKEAMETKYWIRLLAESDNRFQSDLRKLWKEAHELTLIFSKIIGSTKLNRK